MADTDVAAIGIKIRKYREEKGMSAAQLAEAAEISRSYLSELENNKGDHKRPSADKLYAIGKALGVSMSELLGRPLITAPTTEPPPPGLVQFAQENNLPDSDVEMLASIRFRGDAPQTPQRWQFIYNAIKTSASLDPDRPAPRPQKRRAPTSPPRPAQHRRAGPSGT